MSQLIIGELDSQLAVALKQRAKSDIQEKKM